MTKEEIKDQYNSNIRKIDIDMEEKLLHKRKLEEAQDEAWNLKNKLLNILNEEIEYQGYFADGMEIQEIQDVLLEDFKKVENEFEYELDELNYDMRNLNIKKEDYEHEYNLQMKNY